MKIKKDNMKNPRFKTLGIFTFFAFFFSFQIALAADIIIDDEDTGYAETGAIFSSASNACGFNGDFRFETDVGSTVYAEWVPTLPAAGAYRVYVHYCVHSARPDAAVYRVVSDSGITVVIVDQTKDADGNAVPDFTASGWRYIGTFEMTPSLGHKVELDTSDPGDTVADAVRFSPDIIVPDDYTTIQDAITNAVPGATINIGPGTYTESTASCFGNAAMFCIDKSLTLIGDPGSGAAGPGTNAPVIDGGGAFASAFVLASSVSDVSISGFEIRNFANPGCCMGSVGSGVMAWDAGTSDVRVEDNYMHNLGWNGVLVGSDDDTVQSSWTVQRNIITDADYAGIELTNVINSLVRNNEVTVGSGISWDPTDSGVGIEIAVRDRVDGLLAGSNVVVRNNQVDSSVGTGSVAGPRAGINILSRTYSTSTGNSVLDDVTIENNEVSGITTRGIYVTSETRHAGSASVENLEINENVLDSNGDGIVIYDFVNVVGTPFHDNIMITNNDILDSTGPSSGIHIPAGTSASEIEVRFNNIVGNTLLGINNEGSGVLDAQLNWWGSDTGPLDASGTNEVPPCTDTPTTEKNAGATGDGVSDNVDYCPWLLAQVNPSDKTKPEVILFSTSDTSPIKAGTVDFTVTFNKDMNIFVTPDAKLIGSNIPIPPKTGVGIINGWNDTRTWNGQLVITTIFPGDDEYDFRMTKAEDILGNKMKTFKEKDIIIDTVPPVIQKTFAPDIFAGQDLTVSASAYDPGSSGIEKIQVRIDGGSYQDMTFSFKERERINRKNVDVDTYFLTIDGSTITPDGTHTAEFKAIDSAGNEVLSSTIFFDKDSTPKLTGGDIAFVCKDDPIPINSETICREGIERQTILWLISKGWNVEVKKYTDWMLSDLTSKDLVVCTDQTKACRLTQNIIDAHTINNIPFVEISDNGNAKAAHKFGYVKSSSSGSGRSTSNIFVETPDPITTGFFGSTQILLSLQRIPSLSQSKLSPSTTDLGSRDDSPKNSNWFKIESGTQRYSFVGWFVGRTSGKSFTFSGWSPADLNPDGEELLERTLNWAQCGNPTGCV